MIRPDEKVNRCRKDCCFAVQSFVTVGIDSVCPA